MNRFKTYWDQSFTNWKYRLPLHLGFWAFFFSSWLDESMVVKIDFTQYYLVTLVGAIFILFLYYGLVYGLWPLFRKKKWLLGSVLLVLYYIIAVILRAYHIESLIKWHNLHQTNIEGSAFFENLYRSQFQPAAFFKIFFSGFSSLMVIIFVPLIIKFLRYAYQFAQQQAWVLKENTQLQLNNLKAQLNPHFFFNTLNNLQSFIVQKENDKSVDLLNKLADFMRTSLYDGNKEFIPLSKEIELLENYVAIERVRFEDSVQIRISLSTAFGDRLIPPFIFLPFVENAFKHGGALTAEKVKIDITLEDEKDCVVFKASNNFDPNRSDNDREGGIGLENVRKRLAYYFPNGHQLRLTKEGCIFNVYLEINK